MNFAQVVISLNTARYPIGRRAVTVRDALPGYPTTSNHPVPSPVWLKRGAPSPRGFTAKRI